MPVKDQIKLNSSSGIPQFFNLTTGNDLVLSDMMPHGSIPLFNPIHHGSTPEQIATYKVEPYVVAADVYGVAPHTGRGGWTWYMESAGWMYRLLIETLLGVNSQMSAVRWFSIFVSYEAGSSHGCL